MTAGDWIAAAILALLLSQIFCGLPFPNGIGGY